MQKRIADIRREIAEYPARSAWDKGCRTYAEELFSEYIENLQIKDGDVRIGKITEKDLMNGADNWEQYSYGGCALIYDSDICERLCTANEAKRKRYGESKPTLYDNWLDAQTAALKQAARLVCRIANRRD